MNGAAFATLLGVKDHRVVLLAGAVLCAAFAGASACTAPDPGAITFSERPSGTGGDTSSTGGGTTTTTTGDSGTGTTVTPDAVFGTTTFAYADPGLQANKQTAHNGPVVGKDCAQSAACHQANNTSGAPVWTFAGTLYAAGGKTTIAKGEVKVIGPDGGAVGNTYTDQDGNFWYQGDPLPAGSKVGARADGVAAAQHMSTALLATNTGCSSAGSNCHGTTAQGPVHVP